MSEVRTNILISGESSEYRSNVNISIVTLDSDLIDTKSSFRTILNIKTTNSDNISEINTKLELNNVSLKFYLIDASKVNQSILYFSKFLNLNFEPDIIWELLAKGTNEQINISHLSSALSNYLKKGEFTSLLQDFNYHKNLLLNHINNNSIHITPKEKQFIKYLMDSPPWDTSTEITSNFFEYLVVNGNWAIRPIKKENKEVGIISNSFISCKGLDTTSISNDGITREGLFSILTGEPLNNKEYINLKFLDLSSYADKLWVIDNFISEEEDPTVPIHVKLITLDQINSWDRVASWFKESIDGSYIYVTDNRGFVSYNFLSCKGIDPTASMSGGITREDLFQILSSKPLNGEYINLQYLLGLKDFIDNLGYLKKISKSQIIEALGYTPLQKSDFKDFNAVSNILQQDIDNWNFVFGLIDLSEDGTYIFPKENRGLVSNSFLSCKGLDVTSSSIGTLDRSILFSILSGEPLDGEYINSKFIKLENYVTKEDLEKEGFIKNLTKEDIIKILTFTPLSNTDFSDFTAVSKITSSDIDNWNFIYGLIGLSDDETYIFPKENRGIVSYSFISCKGLDNSSSSIGTNFDRNILFDILKNNPQEGEFINLSYINLVNYVTKEELEAKGYLTNASLNNFATKVELSTTNTNLSNLLASHNTLRNDFDNLNTLLNSDVNSTIDTWNEVVAFLDGYSESDDLATILSQMNTDITNKVGYDEFEKVSDATKDLLSYFDVNGYALNALNALKLGGIDAGNYWHKGNSGTLDYDWKTKKLNVRTLVIPTSEPTDLSQGEVGFYLGTAGQGAEEPNGSGGLDLTELWAELGSEDYAKKIHISHIPTIQYSSIAGRPSALVNPYALTINGVVYDGSEPISLDISAGGGVADAVAWSNVFNKPSTISGYGITDAYTKDSVDLKLSNYLPKSGGVVGGLVINATSDAFLQILLNGTSKALVGWQSNHGVRLYNYASASYLSIKDDGTPTYNGNTLIHSGNIGDYAMRYYGTNMPAGIVNYVGYGKVETGWELYGPAISFGISNYYTQIQRNYNSNDIYVRGYWEGNYTDWKTIAFTDSNVASATRLQTARTIWGQSFDGTNGVDGNLYISTAGSLIDLLNGRVIGNATLTLETVGANYARIETSHFGVAYTCPLALNPRGGNVLIGTTEDEWGKLQVYGNSVWIGRFATDKTQVAIANPDGGGISVDSILSNTGNALLNLRYGQNTLGAGGATALLVKDNGNVLIGTTTDNGSKLQVNGDIHINRPGSVNEYLDIQVRDVSVLYKGYDTDGFISHYFYSNDTLLFKLDGYANKAIVAKDLSVGSNAAIGGTLGVAGKSTLGELSANATTLTSLVVSNNAKISGEMDANALVIPTAPPTNPQAGKHYLYLA